MQKFFRAPVLARLCVLCSFGILTVSHGYAQTVAGLAAPATLAAPALPDSQTVPASLTEDFLSTSSESESMTSTSFNRMPLIGLELADASADFDPMLTAMLAFYSQLLAAADTSSSNIVLQRVAARLGGSLDKASSFLPIQDVLAADLDSVPVVALSQSQLTSLGFAAAQVSALPSLSKLTDSVKSSMLSLPASLANFPAAVAIAVWAEGSRLDSLLVRTD